MSKKKVLVLIIVLFLISIGILNTYNSNHFNIDGTNFKIPEGYQIIENDSNVNVTNNIDYILITKDTTHNINKTITNYIKTKEKINQTVIFSNFNIGNHKVYKVSIDNTSVVHYWFENNGKVYELGTPSFSSNSEVIVENLIKSANSII